MNKTRVKSGHDLLDDYAEVWNLCIRNVSRMEVKISCDLDLYLPPVLFALGIISNFVVIVVMRSKYFRSSSTSFYMMASSVTDTASLLVSLPAHYAFVNFHLAFGKVMNAHYLCSFFNILGWGTSDLGILFTVAMTTDRAVAIKYPLRACKLCTPRRALRVVLGLTVFELIKIAHMVTESRILPNSTSRLCGYVRDGSGLAFYVEKVYPWLHIIILIISYAITITGNIIIIMSIRTSKRPLSARGGRRVFIRQASMYYRNRQMSLMLLVDSLALIVCTLPFGVISAMIDVFSLLPDSKEGKNLAFTASFYLLYLNRCLNLVLYCVSGQRFRAAVVGIFCRPWACRGLRGIAAAFKTCDSSSSDTELRVRTVSEKEIIHNNEPNDHKNHRSPSSSCPEKLASVLVMGKFSCQNTNVSGHIVDHSWQSRKIKVDVTSYELVTAKNSSIENSNNDICDSTHL